MPRTRRELSAGEYYHVLARGNNRQALFRANGDFLFYLESLSRYEKKYTVAIFHYCLMTNHVHLLLRCEKSDNGISKMMHGLQLVYAQYFSRRYGTSGHLFEDRFKHFPIDSEGYLLECGRYIERNPVRALIVESPGDYRWSSYAFYAHGEADGVATANPLFLELGPTAGERQRAYQDYVQASRPYEAIVDRFFDERVLVQTRPS